MDKTANYIKIDQERYDELVRKEEQLQIIMRLINADAVDVLKAVVNE